MIEYIAIAIVIIILVVFYVYKQKASVNDNKELINIVGLPTESNTPTSTPNLTQAPVPNQAPELNQAPVAIDTKVKYVEFINPNASNDWNKALNIAEVMLYDSNKQKIIDMTCSNVNGTIDGSTADAEVNEMNVLHGKCDYIIDNNLHSFYHGETALGTSVKIILNTAVDLSYIYVRNRFDKNTRNRLNDVVMTLYNSNGTHIKEFTLTNELNQYFPVDLNSGVLSFEKTKFINIDKVSGKTVNLGELKVYDINGILLNVNSYKIIYDNQRIFNDNQGPITNLFDKDHGSIYHSNESADTKAVSLQLIKPEVIAKVIVINRLDCCQDRAIGVTISLIGESSNIIDKLILSDAKEMSFYPQLKPI